MIRLVGCFLIIVATTVWGIEKSSRLKRQYKNMQYLQRIICLLQSEIRYSRSFLGEIFWKIGQSAYEPYKSWLLDLGEKTTNYTGVSFVDIWHKSIDNYLKDMSLPANEFKILKELGNQMGNADVQVQIRLLDFYLDHTEKTMQEMREEMHTKIRIYHCLGIMSGIFISVLLL